MDSIVFRVALRALEIAPGICIHHSVEEDKLHLWDISHIPSGYKIGGSFPYDEAVQKAIELSKLGDWTFEERDGFKDAGILQSKVEEILSRQYSEI